MKTHATRRTLLNAMIISTMGLSLAAGALYAAGDEGRPAQQGTPQAERQQPQMQPGAQQPQVARPAPQGQAEAVMDVRASELIGMEVVNAQGEKLGEINDVIIDVANERVHYAVLAHGGVLGIGEKLFAYPIRTFQPTVPGDRLVLNVSKEALEAAPGFERRAWPDWNRDDYRGQVDRHFGADVAVERAPDQRLVRASELIGSNVVDMQGQRAGEVEDFVVSLETGEVPFAVLSLDTSWGTEDLLVPIATSALEVQPGRTGDARLMVPRDQIDVGTGFTEDKWPDLRDPANRPQVNGQRRTG